MDSKEFPVNTNTTTSNSGSRGRKILRSPFQFHQSNSIQMSTFQKYSDKVITANEFDELN